MWINAHGARKVRTFSEFFMGDSPLGSDKSVDSPKGAAPRGLLPLQAQDDILSAIMNNSPSPASPIPPPAFFCSQADTNVTQANLPHWEQQGVTCFTTFRLADSLPQGKLDALRAERAEWLDAHPEPWDNVTIVEYRTKFDGQVQKWLDSGYGSCILNDTSTRRIVETVLRRFDRIRYILYAFVIMPNHVHVLFTPIAGQTISTLMRQWKGVSAHEINRSRGMAGIIWQKESWDTLIRNQRHFDSILCYIKSNDTAKAWSVYG